MHAYLNWAMGLMNFAIKSNTPKLKLKLIPKLRPKFRSKLKPSIKSKFQFKLQFNNATPKREANLYRIFGHIVVIRWFCANLPWWSNPQAQSTANYLLNNTTSNTIINKHSITNKSDRLFFAQSVTAQNVIGNSVTGQNITGKSILCQCALYQSQPATKVVATQVAKPKVAIDLALTQFLGIGVDL